MGVSTDPALGGPPLRTPGPEASAPQAATGVARPATRTGRSALRMRASRARANLTTRRAGWPSSCSALAGTPACSPIPSASFKVRRPALISASSDAGSRPVRARKRGRGARIRTRAGRRARAPSARPAGPPPRRRVPDVGSAATAGGEFGPLTSARHHIGYVPRSVGRSRLSNQEVVALALTARLSGGQAPGDDRRDRRSPLTTGASTAAERRGDVMQRSHDANLLLAR
jgi:hypothetical protein